MEDLYSSRRVAEWDWVITLYGDKLHAPRDWYDPAYNAQVDTGSTECGIRGWLSIPGLFSRMGAYRCARCCKATGMPRGMQSPKNDVACVEIAGKRAARWSYNLVFPDANAR